MAKLSKAQNAQHNKILDLVHSDKVLSYDEKIFIYENYNESATVNVREYAAFHTPLNLAWDFSIDAGNNNSVVDLCAGIGILSFCVYHRTVGHCDYYKQKFVPNFLCVELVPEYVALGKRLLPEAEWVCADALTYDVLQHTDNRYKFDLMISNPPFANIKTSKEYQPKIYKGSDFEFKLIERGKDIAHKATVIVPSQSAPFKYSGSRYYQELPNSKAQKFSDLTNIHMGAGCGVDTAYYKDEWKNTKVLCEILDIDYHYNIKLNSDYETMKNNLKFIRDSEEKISELPNGFVDFIFTEMDFETVNTKHKELERLLGNRGQFYHFRLTKDMSMDNLKSMLELFTSEGHTILQYGVFDHKFAKLVLKLKRKFIGIANEKCYEKLKPKFKELKEKYDPKPKKVKVKKSKKKKRK